MKPLVSSKKINPFVSASVAHVNDFQHNISLYIAKPYEYLCLSNKRMKMANHLMDHHQVVNHHRPQ